MHQSTDETVSRPDWCGFEAQRSGDSGFRCQAGRIGRVPGSTDPNKANSSMSTLFIRPSDALRYCLYDLGRSERVEPGQRDYDLLPRHVGCESAFSSGPVTGLRQGES